MRNISTTSTLFAIVLAASATATENTPTLSGFHWPQKIMKRNDSSPILRDKEKPADIASLVASLATVGLVIVIVILYLAFRCARACSKVQHIHEKPDVEVAVECTPVETTHEGPLDLVYGDVGAGFVKSDHAHVV